MRDIETFADGAGWAEACAVRLTDTLSAALAESGKAMFAGSGGSTPAPIYRRMAQTDLDWSKVAVTLIDERYVPETSPESNAALIKQTLMTGPAAAARFVPLYHSEVTVDRAAALAAHALAHEGRHLDAVLLGMGEDGHICSMFPNSPTLKTLLSPTLPPTVLGVPHGRDGAAPSLERLSINLPYLMQARRVVLALTGAAKRAVFEREAAGDQRVQPIAALIAANVPLDVLWTEKA
ncbi:6-phosphogluconolactonase [Brevundimonas sp. Root1423]|uniref:6-phosphogluconolactonase n=1 Tax=Brevundimonas sp. Root1423 TaxID=1736462 RepID=UPI0006FFE704|nr:6-phosphogluconolactonase [Brevundimonas sp. Root1423]KQY84909.1 6-phosphogluconolactonase [Brevundimonas sp. Root1423]